MVVVMIGRYRSCVVWVSEVRNKFNSECGGGGFDMFAIDALVDQSDNIWILEVNGTSIGISNEDEHRLVANGLVVDRLKKMAAKEHAAAVAAAATDNTSATATASVSSGGFGSAKRLLCRNPIKPSLLPLPPTLATSAAKAPTKSAVAALSAPVLAPGNVNFMDML